VILVFNIKSYLVKPLIIILIFINFPVLIFSQDQKKEESNIFLWPLENGEGEITSFYGKVPNPKGEGEQEIFHNGLDISGREGTPILAVADGTVVDSGFTDEYGFYILLSHSEGIDTLYAYLQKASKLKKGIKVKRGDMIGFLGNGGSFDEPYLYFEVREKQEPVNPKKYFLIFDHCLDF
jgi:murein DD-endopeptidase MepM/ murein hydrolase activator NlpD